MIYLDCPYSQKEIAKQNGARWDGARKQWYWPGDTLPDGLKQFHGGGATSARRPGWGRNGVRYDEDCASCGRCGEVDNDTELCERCGSRAQTRQISTTCEAPYSRGIGGGFGGTEDGDL